MKIALACDHIVEHDFSIKILEELCQLYPDADLYTFAHRPGSFSGPIEQRKIYSTFLSHKVKTKSDLFKYNFLIPSLAAPLIKQSNFDVLISVSSGLCHGLSVPSGAKHLCYLWEFDESVAQKSHFISKIFAAYFKRWQISKLNSPEILRCSRTFPNVIGPSTTSIFPPVETYSFIKTLPSSASSYFLVNIQGLSDEELNQLVAIFQELNQLAIYFTNNSEKSFYPASIAENLKFIRCSAEFAELLPQALAYIDLSPGIFRPEMVVALSQSRPVITWDYQIFREFLNPDCAVFVPAKNFKMLKHSLAEFQVNQDAFFSKNLGMRANLFHPTKFKRSIEQLVSELAKS